MLTTETVEHGRPAAINQSRSADFIRDALVCGRRFRTFNVVDDFNREVLGSEVDLNLAATRVIRTQDQIAAWRGYPEKLRLNNGPEFISLALSEWAEEQGVHLEFIQPGTHLRSGSTVPTGLKSSTSMCFERTAKYARSPTVY